MINHSFEKYLVQTKELFGNTLFINKDNFKNNFSTFGNINSDIIFIKNCISDSNEEVIFLNILKALNLSVDKILTINLNNFSDRANQDINSFLNQLRAKTIIVLGVEISQMLLKTDDDLDLLRSKKNILFKSNVIPTYSISNMISNPDLKKYVWHDLKVIL